MEKLANLNNVVGDGRSLETVKSRYQEQLAEFCVNRATTNRCSIVRQRIVSPWNEEATSSERRGPRSAEYLSESPLPERAETPNDDYQPNKHPTTQPIESNLLNLRGLDRFFSAIPLATVAHLSKAHQMQLQCLQSRVRPHAYRWRFQLNPTMQSHAFS